MREGDPLIIHSGEWSTLQCSVTTAKNGKLTAWVINGHWYLDVDLEDKTADVRCVDGWVRSKSVFSDYKLENSNGKWYLTLGGRERV